MDTGSGFYAQDAGDWKVFEDALAPPPTRSRSRAWERAPVSAHAPRLHGQKIWKRAGLRSKSTIEKENIDAAQLELEKEGAGARKKARVLGAKEVTLDATWQEVEMQNASGEVGDRSTSSPGKKDRMSTTGMSEDALVVPRKRTNANHLITPRRPSRRAPLKDVGAGLGSPHKSQPVLKPTGSDVDLFTRVSPRKIALNDAGLFRIPAPSPEKPIRRRKSLRKSLRRLTATSLEDTSVDNTTFDKSRSGSSVVEEEQSKLVDKVGAPALVSPQTTENVNDAAELDSERDQEDLTPKDAAAVESQPQVDLSTEGPNVATTSGDDIKTTAVQETQSPTFEPIENQSAPEAVEYAEDACEHRALESSSNPIMEDIQQLLLTKATTNEVASLPEPEAAATEVFEAQASPSKSRTPRSLKKVSTPRQGSRRSARTTQTSSGMPDIDRGAESPLPAAMTSISQDSVQNLSMESEILEISITLQKPVSPEVSSLTTNVENSVEAGLTDTNDDRLDISHTPDASVDITEASVIHKDAEGSESTAVSNVGQTENIATSQAPAQVTLDAAVTFETSLTITSDVESSEASINESSFDSSLSELDASDITVTQALDITLGALDDGTASTEYLEEASVPSPRQSPEVQGSVDKSSDAEEEDPEDFEPISLSTTDDKPDIVTSGSENVAGSPTADVAINAVVENISDIAPTAKYDEDDTDLLRNFLTRVKANKEAKANASQTKRKKSFPHSPIKLPLGSTEPALSPSPPLRTGDFDIAPAAVSPSKRRRKNDGFSTEDTEPQSIRRSGRTRLPVKAAAVPAPSFIPVRRLGQEGDNTITLRRSDEKELAALTKFNTRKNKGNALAALDLLVKLAQEKEDPASRHQALKQKFDEKTSSKKGKARKSVIWAEEIAQYSDGKKPEPAAAVEPAKEKAAVEDKKSSLPVKAPEEKKTASVKVGVRSSRIAMGMAVNGTPAPKRKGRSLR